MAISGSWIGLRVIRPSMVDRPPSAGWRCAIARATHLRGWLRRRAMARTLRQSLFVCLPLSARRAVCMKSNSDSRACAASSLRSWHIRPWPLTVLPSNSHRRSAAPAHPFPRSDKRGRPLGTRQTQSMNKGWGFWCALRLCEQTQNPYSWLAACREGDAARPVSPHRRAILMACFEGVL